MYLVNLNSTGSVDGKPCNPATDVGRESDKLNRRRSYTNTFLYQNMFVQKVAW